MNKPSTCLVAFALAFLLMPPLFAQVDDSGSIARNPIVWADVPDVAMIRVGDTYSMSSTTMHMSPGLPNINWRVSRILMARYGYHQEHPHYQAELHFLRLGDVAVMTNPFELYTDYRGRKAATRFGAEMELTLFQRHTDSEAFHHDE